MAQRSICSLFQRITVNRWWQQTISWLCRMLQQVTIDLLDCLFPMLRFYEYCKEGSALQNLMMEMQGSLLIFSKLNPNVDHLPNIQFVTPLSGIKDSWYKSSSVEVIFKHTCLLARDNTLWFFHTLVLVTHTCPWIWRYWFWESSRPFVFQAAPTATLPPVS